MPLKLPLHIVLLLFLHTIGCVYSIGGSSIVFYLGNNREYLSGLECPKGALEGSRGALEWTRGV